MSDMHRQAGETVVEMRRNQRLRSIFDTAYTMIEPFFECCRGWAGVSLQHLAFRVLHENFPELTGEQVHQLIVGAYRTYIECNPDCSDHLLRPSELRHFPVFAPAHADVL